MASVLLEYVHFSKKDIHANEEVVLFPIILHLHENMLRVKMNLVKELSLNWNMNRNRNRTIHKYEFIVVPKWLNQMN